MVTKTLSRRDLLKSFGLGSAAMLLASCAPVASPQTGSAGSPGRG